MTEEFRILIIDDNETLCETMRDVLEMKGYAVEYACSGRDALALFEGREYDLVLMDYRLPDISGVDAVEKISKISPATKFIFITGDSGGKDVFREPGKMRVLAWETKPVDIERLLGLINQVRR